MAEIIDLVMRLTDHVTGTLGNIRTQMEQTAKMNQQIGRNLSNAGRHVNSLASAMAPLAVGIAGVGAVGVKTFMDFDQTITEAAVKAGATAEEMKRMKDAAAAMGAKFPTTARDVAAGMDRLAAGGFNANQAIGSMPGIIEAAIASGEDMAVTSDVITSALSIWNLKTGDIAANTVHVADVIQAAANASKMGIADFGLAMQYAGAPAAALGISIEELGTAMGIMANNGIEASSIGTSLRATMASLAAPTGDAAKTLDSLRISAADLKKGDGSFIGLAGAVELLRNKMSGLSDTEQVAAAKAIAGKNAFSGLLALVKTSPEAYKEMTDTITNSTGQSHAAYIKMQDTLKGSMDAMKSAVEGLGISFGSALAPSIRSVADAIQGIAAAFTNLSPEAKQMIIHIGEGIIAFTGLTFAVGKVLSISGTLTTTYGQIGRVLSGHAVSNKALQFAVQGSVKAFGMLRMAGAALMGPMGLVVAGIAIAAFLIYKNWDKIGPFFQKIWDMIKGAFTAAINVISPVLTKLQDAWDTLVNAFRNGTGIFGVLNTISDVLAGILGGELYAAIVLVSGILTGAFTAAFDIVAAIVTAAIGVFSGLIEFIAGVFTGDWSLAWKGIVDIFSSIFGGIQGVAKGILNGIKAAINAVIGGINNIDFTVPDWVPVIGGSHFAPNIPYLARGTDNWLGGPAVINESGGEIVDLPSGARVIPHDQSVRSAYNMGARSERRTPAINLNFYGTTISSNKGDIKEFARKVAQEIQYQMEKEAINSTEGAI